MNKNKKYTSNGNAIQVFVLMKQYTLPVSLRDEARFHIRHKAVYTGSPCPAPTYPTYPRIVGKQGVFDCEWDKKRLVYAAFFMPEKPTQTQTRPTVAFTYRQRRRRPEWLVKCRCRHVGWTGGRNLSPSGLWVLARYTCVARRDRLSRTAKCCRATGSRKRGAEACSQIPRRLSACECS